MEGFRNRPTGQTDITNKDEDKKHKEIPQDTESHEVDKKPSQMAIRRACLARRKTKVDEISQPRKIPEDT